jgi:hypothetical protein
VTAPRIRRRLMLADDGIIDPIGVELAARGARPVALTRAERQIAAARILTRGGTAYLISKRLHVSGTTAPHARRPLPRRGGMTRPGATRPGAAATAPAVPGQWAERALCAQADPDAWFPAKASAAWPRSPRGSAPAARCGRSAWSTRCLAPTPGAASRPGSEAAPHHKNAASSSNSARRWQHDQHA